MSNFNSSIKCNVSACKHHNKANYCQLDSISIGGEHFCNECKETECKSFSLK